jgi:hypothetical protein
MGHPSDEDAWGHKITKKAGKILPKPHPTEGTEAPPANGPRSWKRTLKGYYRGKEAIEDYFFLLLFVAVLFSIKTIKTIEAIAFIW